MENLPFCYKKKKKKIEGLKKCHNFYRNSAFGLQDNSDADYLILCSEMKIRVNQ